MKKPGHVPGFFMGRLFYSSTVFPGDDEADL